MDDLISRQDAVNAIGDAHFNNWGDAVIVIKDMPEVRAISMDWIKEYLSWLKGIGGYGLSDARAIQSMIIKWKMDNARKHSGCGPDYCELGEKA